jgi:hypothetical protein
MPTSLQQLLLGFSVDGSLTAIHPMSQGDSTSGMRDRKTGKPPLYSTSPAVLPGTTYIDTLPTELLRACFDLAFDRSMPLSPHVISYCDDDDDASIASQQHAYNLALSISLTCKRFRAVVMPILYSRVHIIPPPRYRPEERDDLVPMRFIRTMNTAPAAREFVESLGVSTQQFSRISPAPGLEGSGFTRLRKVSLAVKHHWSAWEWEACCANLRNLPALSELRVDLQRRCKTDFRPFYQILGQLPHLSVLTLEGVDSDRFFQWDGDHAELGPDEGALSSEVIRVENKWHLTSQLIHTPVRQRIRILHPASLALFRPWQPHRTRTFTLDAFIPSIAESRHPGSVRLLFRGTR